MSFQSDFAEYLRTGKPQQLQNYIDGDYNANILAVYRNGFYKACVAALAANYPVTKILFGEPRFNFLAQRHVDLHPPQQGTLVGYGDSFIETIKAFFAEQNEDLPQAYVDIALLDRTWLSCLNGADDDHRLSVEQIQHHAAQGQDIENIRVKLAANVFMHSMEPQAFNFWYSSQHPGQNHEATNLPQQTQLLIWRAAGRVQVRELNPADYCFFSQVQKQKTLGEVIATTTTRFPDFDVEACFAACLQNGLLSQTH
ncbi:DNA-binding domain-containing protein [Reinekea marinisedimentorum]|uniref:Putative DNA-binding domain-containing protein n=1 Tax=Reinekea marinisedimentorum TaxID=230495 RepID=A0A4R3I704_9GAMM|nr:DNA-binding domain-containing protein [Reinekea marinisedimentorum]TCS41009.1 hypothetical protein BCF53_10722 [Reinekea marinisedimentorum]